MRKLFLLTLVAGALFAAPQPPTLRLPTEAAPSRYQVTLNLDPAKDDFTGAVTIELQVRQATAVVWLNQNNLTVSAASVEQAGAKQAARVLPGGTDFVGFEFATGLKPGKASLHVEFAGKVNLKAGAGVFLSKRNDDRYLFTQFEAVDARAAFPCYDEPGYKVPWQVTLNIPAGMTAVSNTPVQKETTEGAVKRVAFRPTTPLPSYLVAFGVGPFEFVDGGTACRNHVPVRIVVPRGDAPRAKYAAAVTAEILTRLEEYFDIPYPFEKADQLSIPLSFGGAMENPGLVTYDAGIILAPPQGEDPPQRQRGYAMTAAHELAHQWFGDLVTMAWWNDTWLNESFATFMEQRLVADWKPEWQTKVDDQGARTYAMWLDRLATARRIDQPIESKSDIANAFDGITYQKGGAVLAMFNNYMGPEHFRQAVRFYLRKHAHANGTAQDFLDALGEIGGPKVPASFRTFLQQAGTPEVAMRLKCEGGHARVELSQQRFLPLGSTDGSSQLWTIPVCVAYGNGSQREKQCTELAGKQGVLELKGEGCPAWFLGNDSEVGYYYTRYESADLTKLVENRSSLTLAEQAGLFGEIDNVMRAGRLPVTDGLKLAVLLKAEPKRQIAEAAIQFAGVRTAFLPPNLRPKYAAFVRENFGPAARRLGWIPRSGESEDEKLLRPALVTFVARDGEDPELIATAKDLVNKWLETRQALPSETFHAIFSTAARNGDAALYDKILKVARSEKDEFFLQTLVSSLGAFRDPELVKRSLQLFLEGSFDVRMSYSLMFGAQSTPELARMPYDFLVANYDKIAAALPGSVGGDYAAYLPQTAGFACSAWPK
jgi:alanyl aminopeptidase